jgi:DNA repair protein RecO (recombination protein O)
VCFSAAQPYLDKLLPLPEFLKGGTDESDEQVLYGLRLTGHFLNCHVYETRQLPMPEARGRVVSRLAYGQHLINGANQQAILANKDE